MLNFLNQYLFRRLETMDAQPLTLTEPHCQYCGFAIGWFQMPLRSLPSDTQASVHLLRTSHNLILMSSRTIKQEQKIMSHLA
jgi:hypothetical protein